MKLKHYKFPAQNYPPRISFKLVIKSPPIMADYPTPTMDEATTPLSDALADQTCMIDIVEQVASRKSE